METLKAGCFLIDKARGMIALVHRENYNDYSFPKGHVEKGESVIECAIRETEEETKRIPQIVHPDEPCIEYYTTPKGEHCKCYMFIALDGGHSDNDSADTHEVVWVKFGDVENRLSYPSLQHIWSCVKETIFNLLSQNVDF